MRFSDQSAAKPDAIPRLNDLYLADEEALVSAVGGNASLLSLDSD